MTECELPDLRGKTFQDVRDAARVAIAERGSGYVYQRPFPMSNSCYYVHRTDDGGETCGCLVGHILHQWGVSLDWLAKNEVAIGALNLAMPGDVREALVDLQAGQDEGKQWSVVAHELFGSEW